MNFTEFRKSLKFKSYSNNKIIIRYAEYKIKNFIIDILINFNKFKSISKKVINLGSYSDNSYINFLIYSLKDEYLFAYDRNEHTKKLFKRIGFLNFFKHTISNHDLKKKPEIQINMLPDYKNKESISINTNYFDYLYSHHISKKHNGEIIMPYFMYPRIYNSFYKKINIVKRPDFNLRVFFSGSMVVEGYNSFIWEKEPKKYPNRIKVINQIIKEFKNDIYLIHSKKDLKTNNIFNKKIIFCLHDKMIKKTSYTLNFKNNFNLLSRSCFNLSCPGVVMPLCHHLIEGIKVGSIPITNCEKLLFPNLNKETSLQYSNLDDLIEKIYQALEMNNDEILFMRSKVQKYYKKNLFIEVFKKNFKKMLKNKEKKIICCDDHRSVKNISNN